MSPESSGRAPRSSPSPRPLPSPSPSSSGNERRTRREPGRFSGTLSDDIGGGAPSTSGDDDRGSHSSLKVPNGSVSPRNTSRGNGGFLLNSTNRLSQKLSRFKAEGNGEGSEVVKGKRKMENGDLFVRKRSNRPSEGKEMSRSSPLSTEIRSYGDSGNLSQAGSSSKPSNSGTPNGRNSVQSMASTKQDSATSGRHQPSDGNSMWRNSVGLDTDPAQIVSLALNLGESRKRHTSNTMHLSPRDISGLRRIVSGGTQNHGHTHESDGSHMRRGLQDLRQPSANRFSQYRSPSYSHKAPAPGSHSHSQNTSPKLTRRYQEGAMDEVLDVFEPSDATLARAEKARVALELGFEFRRLLQYLPAIPKGSYHKPNSPHSRDGHQDKYGDRLGREYNPLQYIRNRKVRLREKKQLNPELDGWNDVQKVRDWVENVRNDRDIGISRIDDRFPLPPFDDIQDPSTVINGLDSPNKAQAHDSRGVQLPRPEYDWIFAPWDLLADVYWLDQHHNIERIEDSTGHRIIANPQHHAETPTRNSKDIARIKHNRSAASSVQLGISPEGGMDDIEGSKRLPNHHGIFSKQREPKSPSSNDHFPRVHRGRWSKKLLRSRSSSSSDDSVWSKSSRPYPTYDASHNGILEKQMMEELEKEAHEEKTNFRNSIETNESLTSPAKTAHHVAEKKSLTPQRPQTLHRMKTDDPSANRKAASPISSGEESRSWHRRMSSNDLLTAPTSPVDSVNGPNIIINSPPTKTSPFSAISPLKRPFVARLGSFRRDRSRSVDRRTISDGDAAQDQSSSIPVTRQTTRDSLAPSVTDGRSINSTGGLLPAIKLDPVAGRPRGSEGKSSRHVRDPSDSRFRGIFKGGRIAELVGNEVSKVGDRIWKKESSSNLSHMLSPTSQSLTDESTDDAEYGDALSKLESTTPNPLGSNTGNNDLSTTDTWDAIGEDRPKFHMDNLPSFKSPFNDDRSIKSGKASVDDEHPITRQQRTFRERGRSSKLDRLPPPRLDMRSVSRSTRGESRSRSQVRHGATSRDGSPMEGSSGVLHANALGVPGQIGSGLSNQRPMTGLAAFSSTVTKQADGDLVGRRKPWSISDRGPIAVKGNISLHDIARVRALLLSSGIKAHELTRRYEEPPEKASAQLKAIENLVEGSVPLVPPAQENVFVARTLIMDLESVHKEIQDAAEMFSTETADGLQNQIKAVNEKANEELTPRVQTSADDSDNFAIEMTTSHTLAMKQLNDSIDAVLRRRRRRNRWLRKGGWALLEWFVLGCMWLAWLIAVIVRIFRGFTGGAIRVFRWLLWL